MIKTLATTVALAIAVYPLSTPVFAADAKMDHSQMDHGTMDHAAKPSATEATGTGVVNAVDATKKQINLNHDPMPELGWPAMTMDLPVTNKVDLEKIKPGDKVTFRLKLGRDKTYRITELEAAK